MEEQTPLSAPQAHWSATYPMSRGRSRSSLRVELKAVCVMAAGLSLAMAAARERGTRDQLAEAAPFRRASKTLHSGKLHIKAVVYGSSGEIKDDAFKLKPHDGVHHTTVKVGPEEHRSHRLRPGI